MKQNIQPLHQREYKPKRESIPRTWFLAHGYTKADTRYTNGHAIWLHPKTNDVLNQNGQKVHLRLLPTIKFKANSTRYLALSGKDGNMYLARLKYLTFKGEIPAGFTIDHIDGNPLNNDISNLRAIPRAINDRDGGFLRKLRNHGIIVAMYPGIILEGYARMAEWKSTHTRWQYECLTREDLLRIFVGPTFTVIDPNILMDLDFKD
jgi:hypothetical protein